MEKVAGKQEYGQAYLADHASWLWSPLWSHPRRLYRQRRTTGKRSRKIAMLPVQGYSKRRGWLGGAGVGVGAGVSGDGGVKRWEVGVARWELRGGSCEVKVAS